MATPERRALFHDWLCSLVPLAAASRRISVECIGSGFRGLDRAYGGAFSLDPDTPEAEIEFEEELIKEAFCGASQMVHGVLERIGYRSSLVTSELARYGLNRSDLLSLGRSSAADAALEAAPWGRRYTRSFLTRVRSDDAFIAERDRELEREAFELGAASSKTTPEPVGVLEAELERALQPSGFVIHRGAHDCVVFRKSESPTAFLVRVNSLARSFPVDFSMFVFPSDEFFGVARLAGRAVHSPFVRWLGALIPNLPIYQVARNPNRLALAVALNSRILAEVASYAADSSSDLH
jgi:hypothetical protein